MWQLSKPQPSASSRSEPCLAPKTPNEPGRTGVRKEGLRKFYKDNVPKRMNRATMSLVSGSELRGIHSNILLDRCGHRLRGTSGGVDASREEHADEEFNKSFELDDLDIFLSHSWHAPWKRKYLALLLYFNFWPSVLVYVAFNALCAFGITFSDIECKSTSRSSLGFYCKALRVAVQTLGIPVFFASLFSWHHIIVCCKRRSIFLDKVCIHQTDKAKKIAGIKSIAAFLKRSKTLLVAWDTSYFYRLWCAFELSAYLYSHQNPAIKVLPVELCVFKFSFICQSLFGNVIDFFMLEIFFDETPATALLVTFFVNALVISVTIPGVRQFMRYRESLSSQLAKFSVRDARCFCCDNKHVDPETGATLSCDRELVYASIQHWHSGDKSGSGPTLTVPSPDGGESVDAALDEFDLRIRSSLAQRTKSAGLGISYSFSMATGVFRSVRFLMPIVYFHDSYAVVRSIRKLLGWGMTMCLDIFVSRPLVLAVTCILARFFREERSSLFKDICLNLLIGCAAESGQTLVNAWVMFSATFPYESGRWITVLLRLGLLLLVGIPLKKIVFVVPKVDDSAIRRHLSVGWTSDTSSSFSPEGERTKLCSIPSETRPCSFTQNLQVPSEKEKPMHRSYPEMKKAASSTSTEFEIEAASSVLHSVATPASAENNRESVLSNLELAAIDSQKDSSLIWH